MFKVLKKMIKILVNILLWVLGLLGPLGVVIILAIMIIIQGINLISDLDLFSGIAKKEQQQADIAMKQYYERISDTASYGMFSKKGDREESLFKEIKSKAKEDYPELFIAMDYNDKFLHDANNQKILDLKQLEAFDALGDAEKYFRDIDGREKIYNSMVDAGTLMILNNELLENGSMEDSTESILYAEQFAKPVAFVYDYRRVDEDGNDYVYVIDRDDDGKVISEITGKVYDFEIDEKNESDYYKNSNGVYKDLPISYVFEEERVDNEFGNEYLPLKRTYFEIDEDGEPIVEGDDFAPMKHIQLVPLTNEYGQVTVKSLTKYNTSSERVKKAIINNKDVEERAKELYAEFPSKYMSGADYDIGYTNALSDARKELEGKAIEGVERYDWEWDYKGEYKNLGETQKDNSLKYVAEEKDFRYAYYDKKVYDRVYYDLSSGVPQSRSNPDYSYEFKNLEYAWDFSIDKAVYKVDGSVLPMELKSVKDYGLALLATYIEGRSVEFMQALAVDEERDPSKINEYLQSEYNPNFKEANNGYYPTVIEESDDKIREKTFNEDLLEYLQAMSDKYASSIQSANIVGHKTGSRINSTSLSNTDKFDDLIIKYSSRYGVDPILIKAMMAQESSGNDKDSSGWGWGLGQIEDTHYGKGEYPWNRQQIAPNGEVIDMWITRNVETDDRLDVEKNLRWVTAHMGSLVKMYNGDNLKALIGYNSGSGAMNALQKAYPDDWLENIGEIPRLLGKTTHGDLSYISNVLSYYDGDTYNNVDLPPSQNYSSGVISQLITEETLNKDGSFAGIDGFRDEEFNKKIKLKTPYVESTIFNGLDIKDQAVNPQKYYNFWFDKLNQDTKALEFWVPKIANIADKIDGGVFKDFGVNGDLDFSKFSQNENIEEKMAEIKAKGDVIYSSPSMTEQIYLMDEATTFVGTFMHTYKEETRFSRGLGENESKAVVDLYEVGKHWVADKWLPFIIVEEGRFVKNYETGELEFVTEERSLSLPPIDIGLEIYQEDIIPLFYDESDEGIVLIEGFLPDGDYKTTEPLMIPEYSKETLDTYNFERGTYGTLGYLESRVIGIEFELDVIDNRNNGELKELYRHYYGNFYETRPYEANVYYEDELSNSWRDRMTKKDDMKTSQEKKINRETSDTLSYVEGYIKNFEVDVPNQALKDWNAFSRTSDFYGDVVQKVEAGNSLSGDLKSLMPQLKASFNLYSWDKAFSSMGVITDKEKEVVAEVILGLLEEEKRIIGGEDSEGRVRRKGYLNIYANPSDKKLNSNTHYNGRNSTSFEINVNGEEDARENDTLAINYVSATISNLILKYKGDMNKAIMAYHITPEAMDILLERADVTWANRTGDSDELNRLASEYGGMEDHKLNANIVQDALSYVSDTEGQQNIANTSTKWYQELWKKAKNITKSIIDTGDNILDKMFGEFYTSKENKGIYSFRNFKTEADYMNILQRIMARKKKIPFEEVTWELFDFFIGGEGDGSSLVLNGGTGQTGNLEDYADLIYNIETYVTPIQMATPPLSSPFGYRFHPVDKIWKMHSGIDVGIAGGTPIVNIADGVVTHSGWLGGYGNTVMIKHPIQEGSSEYITSLYAHMNKPPLVKNGTPVVAGQTIGYVGKTGKSTGNHLHFEIIPSIQPSNPNFAKWQSLMFGTGKKVINPFHFTSAEPTPEQLIRYNNVVTPP